MKKLPLSMLLWYMVYFFENIKRFLSNGPLNFFDMSFQLKFCPFITFHPEVTQTSPLGVSIFSYRVTIPESFEKIGDMDFHEWLNRYGITHGEPVSIKNIQGGVKLDIKGKVGVQSQQTGFQNHIPFRLKMEESIIRIAHTFTTCVSVKASQVKIKRRT